MFVHSMAKRYGRREGIKEKTMQMTFDVPVVRKVDVLVIGGGCAGLAAAVSAARHGAIVLIADANNALGGMATSGLVGPFMTCYNPVATRQVIKGIFDETVRRMIEKGGAKTIFSLLLKSMIAYAPSSVHSAVIVSL